MDATISILEGHGGPVKLGLDPEAVEREGGFVYGIIVIGGKGGGRKNLAQGGGKDGTKLEEALKKIRELVKEQIQK